MPENVVLKAKRKFFTADGQNIEAGQRVTLSEAAFIYELELKKGWQPRESTNPSTGPVAAVSNNPASPYLNHCNIVSCSRKVKEAHKVFMKKKGA